MQITNTGSAHWTGKINEIHLSLEGAVPGMDNATLKH